MQTQIYVSIFIPNLLTYLLDENLGPSGSRKIPTGSGRYPDQNDDTDYEEETDRETTVPRKAGGSGRADQSRSSESPRRRQPTPSSSSRQPAGSRRSKLDSGSNDYDNGDDEDSLPVSKPGKEYWTTFARGKISCNLFPL